MIIRGERMKNKENDGWIREKEYIQQVVYNEVLYLPVPKLKIKKTRGNY